MWVRTVAQSEERMASYSVILAAAGKSSRFQDPNFKKPFAPLRKKAIWLYSAELFLKRADVKQVIMVISPEDKEDFLTRFGPNLAVMGIDVALGGGRTSRLDRKRIGQSQSRM